MTVSAARRITEVLVGPLTLKRRLPTNAGGGVVIASARVGGLKYLLKNPDHWDSELLSVAGLLIESGQSVWDVGANVGLFSKAAAFHAGGEGSVLSIEADLDAVALLNRTCRYREPGHARMTVLPVAISESVGIVRFAIAVRARAANSIEGFGSTQTGGVKEIRTLPSTTLDSLLSHFPAPAVLKIDVEGAELAVLRGAVLVLSRSRPRIYCEVTDVTRADAASLLQNNGYTLWDGHGFNGSFGNSRISHSTTNLVAIPQEQTERFFARRHD